MITNEMLSRFSADFNAEKCHKIAMNAVTQNGVTKSAMSPMALRKDEHQFSINLKQGEITEPEVLRPLLDVRGAEHDAL